MMVNLQRPAGRIDGKESVGAPIVKARFCCRMSIGGKDNLPGPRPKSRQIAKRTRLTGCNECCALETCRMLPLTGVPDRHHLGMGRRIRSRGDFVHSGPKDPPMSVDNESSERNTAPADMPYRQVNCMVHEMI